jgi:uncharacterized membrane protein
MDKILVVVFDNEGKAYEGLRALQDLQHEGTINLYANAVLVRGANGKVAVKQEGDMGPVGTAVGLLTGSLIGLFGGPVGLAIGAGAGVFGGLAYDLAQVGIDFDFLDEIGQSLVPGETAVVAEVQEDWTVPVDSRMEPLGGVVLRRTRKDILDTQAEADITTLKGEMDELGAAYDQASADTKVKLQAKMEQAKARFQSRVKDIQARLETSQQETEAKIQALQEQASKAQGERNAKIEKRIAELRAQHRRRSRLLERAGQLIKEAVRA